MGTSPSTLQSLTNAYKIRQEVLDRANARAEQAARELADAQAAASGDGSEPPGSKVSAEEIQAIAGRRRRLERAQESNDRATKGVEAETRARDDAWKKLCAAADPAG